MRQCEHEWRQVYPCDCQKACDVRYTLSAVRTRVTSGIPLWPSEREWRQVHPCDHQNASDVTNTSASVRTRVTSTIPTRLDAGWWQILSAACRKSGVSAKRTGRPLVKPYSKLTACQDSNVSASQSGLFLWFYQSIIIKKRRTHFTGRKLAMGFAEGGELSGGCKIKINKQ